MVLLACAVAVSVVLCAVLAFRYRRRRRLLDNDPVQLRLVQLVINAGQSPRLDHELPLLLLTQGYSAHECRIRLTHAARAAGVFFRECHRHSEDAAELWKSVLEDPKALKELAKTSGKSGIPPPK